MADASLYKTILDTQQTQVAGLTLAYQNKTIPAAVRKLPRAEEGLDSVPLICIAPDDKPPSFVPWSSEDEILAKYTTSIVLVMPSNADFTDTDMDLTARFLEQIRGLFQWGITGIMLPNGANLFFAEILAEPLYRREKLSRQYSYSGMSYRFWMSENRTNP